ncbi:LysR family transcriptional regulator [Mangrovicoccus sp. HB161399]|uniref:LysR family transcriptional regulator n=1 Tax=Mangrovicoccus sp. HB161399 TaxID=2720392 RepID=UPI0015538F8F|nr:LysR family transcriptional regulator [Mangrovicoccus sp. HB161399]
MSDIGKNYTSLSRHAADLCLFLLVADCGQLSLAAETAGLSQPRLSQRIKALEESLGRVLFQRHRRGVTLTREGRELAEVLGPPLGEAAAGFARLTEKRQRRQVVIQSDLAFASFRFLPAFPSLCAAFPDLGLSLMTRQLPEPGPRGGADLMVRMEPAGEDGPSRRRLFPERVQAVASPGFLARHPGLATPADLATMPLIDLAADGAPPWFTWTTWLRRFGVALPARAERITFSSYDHVIQAAEEGLGVALGWRGLTDARLEAGTLAPAVPQLAESGMAYVLRMETPGASKEVRAVFDWIAARFGS